MRYDEATFMATHNSYSGGSRGSVPSQLEFGVRGLELDVHPTGHGFEVGHLWAGEAVPHSRGSPESDSPPGPTSTSRRTGEGDGHVLRHRGLPPNRTGGAPGAGPNTCALPRRV